MVSPAADPNRARAFVRRRVDPERTSEVESGSAELSGRLDRNLIAVTIALLVAVMVLRLVTGVGVKALVGGSYAEEASKLAADVVGAVAVIVLLTSLGWWRRVGFVGRSHWRDVRLLGGPALLAILLLFTADVDLSDSTQTALELPQPLLTGFWEEGLTRGFLLFAFLVAAMRAGRGPWPAVIGSAAIFGLLHFLNLANDADPAATASQVVFAALLGAGFAALLLRTNALWLLVGLHALINVRPALEGDSADPSGFSAGSVLFGLLFALYAVFLLRRDKSRAHPEPA